MEIKAKVRERKTGRICDAEFYSPAANSFPKQIMHLQGGTFVPLFGGNAFTPIRPGEWLVTLEDGDIKVCSPIVFEEEFRKS